MSVSIKNNRISLYFSPRKDRDLIDEFGNIEAGDVSWFIKELMRDGIKHRKGGYPVVIAPETQPCVPTSTKSNVPSGASSFEELMNMSVKKNKLSDEETEDMFDRL